MSGDPLQGLSLATGTITALDAAVAAARDRPVGSFDILAATIATDPIGHWETVQLRATFIDPREADQFPDADSSAGGRWAGVALTRDACEALATAAEIAARYDLFPLPPGALALGLVWRPETGAARALLIESEIDHPALLDLLQDGLLDTRLEGLLDSADNSPAETGPARSLGETTARHGGGPRVPPPGATELADEDPTIQRLLTGARLLRSPTAPGEPWVLAREERELNVYDLRAMGEPERRRAEAEASIALSLDDIPGAVPALAVREEDGWLVIETARLGARLEEHLEQVAQPGEQRLPAEEYAGALAGVAATLQRLHERGFVHRRIEPSSLRLDPGSGELAVALPAIAGLDEPSAASRYRAPESLVGEVGPSVDQYALGVTARDVFAAPSAPPITAPLHRALQRATAPSPADRFPTIAEFGQALEAAVRAEAPRGTAERVAALSPAARAALTPTAIALVATVAAGTAIAPGAPEGPELVLITSALLLVLVTGFCFGAVTLAGKLRGRRTFASLRLASRPLVPFLVFAVLLSSDFNALEDSDTPAIVFRSLVIAYGGCALLAPARPDSGALLIALLGLWDRRRGWPPTRRRAISLALAVAAVTFLAAPALASLGWRNFEYPTESAREFSPLTPVWNFRVSLDHGEYGFVCDKILTATAAGGAASCHRLARFAAAVQRSDAATARSQESFGMRGTLDSFRVQEIPAAEGLRVWNLLTPTGKLAGAMYTEPVGKSSQLVVMISRDRPRARSEELRSTWLYQVAWTGREWRLVEYRACELAPPGTGKRPARCAITNSTSVPRLKRLIVRAEAEEQRQ